MPLITIATIKGPKSVDAEVFDLWAIHRAPDNRKRFQVTHLPTGYSFLGATGATKPRCRALITEIAASGLDWSFKKPTDLSVQHKRVGKALRKKYTDMELA